MLKVANADVETNDVALLNGTVNNATQTNIVVDDPDTQNYDVGDFILVKGSDTSGSDEIMQIRTIASSTNLTVYRGMMFSTPVTHGNNTPVKVITHNMFINRDLRIAGNESVVPTTNDGAYWRWGGFARIVGDSSGDGIDFDTDETIELQTVLDANSTGTSAFKDAKSEELNIIIKSDVHGSSEAIKSAINQIKHEEVKPKILLSDIGMITETDVTLAKASKAILIAFNVKPSKEAKKRAENEKIKISSFNIIYEVLDFIKNKMSGLLTPDINEKIIGTAEILQIFKVSKVGKVAGSKVVDGEITQDSNARVIRDGAVIFNGKIGSIFREKNQTKQVSAGLECGITLKDYGDFQTKDIIEVYNSTVTERTI